MVQPTLVIYIVISDQDDDATTDVCDIVMILPNPIATLLLRHGLVNYFAYRYFSSSVLHRVVN